RRVVKLKIGNQILWGTTRQISEVGAEIEINQKISDGLLVEDLPLKLKIVPEEIYLQGNVTNIEMSENFPCIKVRFEEVNLSEKRQLIELLFCRPGQWQRLKVPGELKSLWLLLRVFLKPRFIFERKPKQEAMEVGQL
ncbi:PilZ domain-containing protein, partial [Okeania sp. SIO2B9]